MERMSKQTTNINDLDPNEGNSEPHQEFFTLCDLPELSDFESETDRELQVKI